MSPRKSLSFISLVVCWITIEFSANHWRVSYYLEVYIRVAFSSLSFAQQRWQDQIQSSQFSSVHWRFALPNTSAAIATLNALPRRTQIAINTLRVKAKTSRLVIDKDYTCAYCTQDITCQCIHDLTECPRTSELRQQLLEPLKPEQHVIDKQHLAINILITQTLRQYQELKNYTVYKPPRPQQ